MLLTLRVPVYCNCFINVFNIHIYVYRDDCTGRSISGSKYCWKSIILILFNPFRNKPWFLCVCSTSLLKTLWEKEKLLVTSNFSFSHSVFYPFGELSGILIKFEIVVCKLFQFWRVLNLSFGKGLRFGCEVNQRKSACPTQNSNP